MSRVFSSLPKPSSSRRCLQSLLQRRGDRSANEGRAAIRRWYTATATMTAPSTSSASTRPLNSRRPPSSSAEESEYLDDEASESEASASRYPVRGVYTPQPRIPSDATPLVKHLESIFERDFPPKLAKQMLTHISAKESWEGHNARLSFIGRRILHSYLHLFLHECLTKSNSSFSSTSSPSVLSPSSPFDFDLIAYRALKTHELGEFVGKRWRLNKAMLWTPAYRGLKREEGAGGLYKVMGTTVEAVIGGMFHQFGGQYAHQVFHTDVLPSMLCPGSPYGLHDVFHEHALRAAEQMRSKAAN